MHILHVFLTLHHILLHHLTQLLHVGLGEVFAVLGGLEPLVRASIALEFGWSRLRDLAVGHGECDLAEEERTWRTKAGEEEGELRDGTL